MLVLSRRQGETIVISGRVRVTVDRVRGNRVRLAIDAPEEVTVDREEIWATKHDEAVAAVDQPAATAQLGSCDGRAAHLRAG